MKYKNNPFNIRSGSRWLGLSGSKNGFCEFESLDYGIRAACILLMQSYRKKGCLSLSSIINRFAPSCENNTSAYIGFVSSVTNYSRNHIFVIPFEYAKLLSAMVWYESHTDISVYYILKVINDFNISVFSLTSKN